jgi:hypothetical protein
VATAERLTPTLPEGESSVSSPADSAHAGQGTGRAPSPSGSVKPDPKPPRRVRDRLAVQRKLFRDPWCRVCGQRASSGHHLVYRSGGGDDIEEMIVPTCGDGTSGCHGKLHAGDRMARRRLGRNLRPEEVLAVLKRMGPERGLDYLRRRYFLPRRAE